MKTRKALAPAFASTILLALLLLRTTAAYTITQEAPLATITSGSSHPLVFSETQFNLYGTETDNQFGSNDFSIQLNGYQQTICFVCHPTITNLYMFQPSMKYIQDHFQFDPQIFDSLNNALPNIVWQGTKLTSPTVVTSQLSNYVVLQGINGGSSSLSVTVTSCGTFITIPSSSMYAAILNMSTCTIAWSNDQTFPTQYEIGFSSMQTGVLGLGNGSTASFTSSVIHAEEFEYTCASTGCTYSFSNPNGQPGYTAETSNLTYVANPDASGQHIFECQESPNESVC